MNASPLVSILPLPSDDVEALQDVYDIIDASTLYLQFTCALVQVKKVWALAPIYAQESSAQLSQTFLLPTVNRMSCVSLNSRTTTERG